MRSRQNPYVCHLCNKTFSSGLMGEQTVNGMNVEESSSSAVTVKWINHISEKFQYYICN